MRLLLCGNIVSEPMKKDDMRRAAVSVTRMLTFWVFKSGVASRRIADVNDDVNACEVNLI